MYTRLSMRVIFVVMVGILTLMINGCSSPIKKTTMHGSEVLLTKNPIQKVAIVGEARVMRPRMGGKDAILSLSGSKMFVEDAVPKLKQAFENKGYQVVFAEPAAVGYYWRGPDGYWVYDYEEKEDEEDKWQVSGMDAVYEYPQMLRYSPSFKQAVKTEFERLNDDISVSRFSVYDPKQENISVIANETGADTVCFSRLWGKRYSAGRYAGYVAFSVVAAMFGVVDTSGGPKEHREVDIICAESKTGQVVWSSTYATTEDPIGNISYKLTDSSPATQGGESDFVLIGSGSSDAFFNNALATLPAVNQTIKGDCRMQDRVRRIIGCVKP